MGKSGMKPHGYYDLVDAFSKPRCAVCDQVLHSTERFLDYFLNDRLLEQATYDAFRARRGLCNEHAWQVMRSMGNSTSLAILYNVAMDEILKSLDAPSTAPAPKRGLFGGSKSPNSLADRLEPTGQCVACASMQESEAHYLKILAQHISDNKMRDAYTRSVGLCLPHFRMVLRATDRPENQAIFLETQRSIWKRLKADLEEFIAKMDYRRSNEQMGVEGDSWRRAAQHTAGEEGAFGVDPREKP